MSNQTLYHITSEDLWEAALNRERYDHPSRKTDGFIHLSTAEELKTTLEKYFADASSIVLLHIQESLLERDHLKYEDVEGRDTPMPHYYARIPMRAVQNISIEQQTDGRWAIDVGK